MNITISETLMIVLILMMAICLFLCRTSLRKKNVSDAIAVFEKGHVKFYQTSEGTMIDVLVHGLSDGDHGFHIHEYGDLSQGCDSACDHYNPTGETHGDLSRGHVGDLGNIRSKNGYCRSVFIAPRLKLADIVGRSIVIHADPDDLGQGGNEESLKTGNAGKRLFCAVIGLRPPTVLL